MDGEPSDSSDYESPVEKLISQSHVLTELLPTNWYKIYMKCIKEGFSREQAFQLLQTYILGSCKPVVKL